MVYLLKSCVLKNNLCYNYIRKINEKSIVGEDHNTVWAKSTPVAGGLSFT